MCDLLDLAYTRITSDRPMPATAEVRASGSRGRSATPWLPKTS